eukprot:CAMPEP_0113469228 /NCGR_PEP_ID=MMETSP0014_2-20120614/15785_1 /TAXON_ID=2857 /ORGANISM="Nitzschia sp." /LENGTH=616 /DNA_ID=CAMNT_0000361687 /DNA_START=193 /DNA_END=2043 /DNA_ORIENTATION=- /assembly_acc=CAM_ASM_000159
MAISSTTTTTTKEDENSKTENGRNWWEAIIPTGPFFSFPTSSSPSSTTTTKSPGKQFLQAVNDGDVDFAMSFIASARDGDDDDHDDIEFYDALWPSSWNRQQLERNLRLQCDVPSSSRRSKQTIVIDDVVYDQQNHKEGVVFHVIDNYYYNIDDDGGDSVTSKGTKKGIAFFNLNPSNDLIEKAFVVKDDDKAGESGLKVLKVVSDIISTYSSKTDEETPVKSTTTASSSSSSSSIPRQYFSAWNDRDMDKVASLFDDDVFYDDTAFKHPFQGKEALGRHIQLCADCLPGSFSFVLDDEGTNPAGNKIISRWHVENGSEELPFTRGVSLYETSPKNGKIIEGTDWKEIAVFKLGPVNLFFQSLATKLQEEPIRWIPIVTWVTYCYVVFFSEWFFGVPAQALEQRTWEEVRDLSLNFFLVSPILGLPFAPVVHPGLEAIFNLLLSWAAMFAGFLSDDRPKKPNLFPMLPTVIGMQFLTSAFLLPYLASRTSEKDREVYFEDLSPVTSATESKALPLLMTGVGSGSIAWGLLARYDQFGGLQERFASLIDLFSIDRVGASFVVDLAIFAAFQGWFIDDDMKRRSMDADSWLGKAGKFFPFFGMAVYLTLRDPIPNKTQ